LKINGQAVFVTGQPNQTIDLGMDNRVVINEQFTAQTATTADITVNALHIYLCNVGEVVVSSATAGVTCGASPGGDEISAPPGCDFVTGGGWITGTPSGAKANFGVGGGFKNGAIALAGCLVPSQSSIG
jgi:hypothetical protein